MEIVKEFEDFGSWEDDSDWTEGDDVSGLDALLPLFMPKNMDMASMLETWSDSFYPYPYCGCVEAAETACYEHSVIELWGDQVKI